MERLAFTIKSIQESQNKRTPHFLIGAIMFLTMMTSILPAYAQVFAILMLPCMVGLFFFDEFYIVSAVFLFFTEQLVIVSNMPVYRAYAYLLIIRFIVFDMKRTKAKVWIIPIVFILILYGVFVLPRVNVSSTIRLFEQRGISPPAVMEIRAKFIWNYAINALYTILLAIKFQNSPDLFRRFLKWLVYLAMISGVYGLRAKNIYVYDDTGFIDITRQRASFNDPNYASLFMNIAIFLTLVLDDFKSLPKKIIILAVLYYFLIASGSMTGFILNGIGLVAFAVIRYKLKALIAIISMTVIAGSGYILFTKVPALSNLKIINSVVTRINYQFNNGEEDDLNRATSGRAGQWKKYLEYFGDQEMGAKLLGGNIVMTSSLDPYFEENFKFGPHQAYIGLLLDIGIVGTAIMLIAFLIKMGVYGIVAVRKKDDIAFSVFMISLSWLVYGMALDYFFDIRFMLFYFI